MKHAPYLRTWLIAMNIMIIIMVIIGGVTRLTGSGLSMVTWSPIMGILPPMNTQDWVSLFTQYQQFPQYQQLNSAMTLVEFKRIFFWEYVHRILGRLLGFMAIVPVVIAWFRNSWPRRYIYVGAVIIIWIGLQGVVGWWMVKSGLVRNPSVSHIRLAVHLVLAVSLFQYILWQILSVSRRYYYDCFYLKRCVVVLIGILFIQIVYGAFTAGLHAGHWFATFPKMGHEWLPKSAWMMVPFWKNSVYNPIMVQWIHRTLGWSILLGTGGIIYAFINRAPYAIQKILVVIGGVVVCQFSMGVLLLLWQVPQLIAVGHQIGALVLLSSYVWLYHRLAVTPQCTSTER